MTKAFLATVVVFALTGPAPAWATGNHKVGPYAPKAGYYGQFVKAAAQHFAGRVRKSGQRLDVDRALGAIEIMLLVFVPLGLGKFAEHVLYCSLQSYCPVMVHRCHPKGSAIGR